MVLKYIQTKRSSFVWCGIFLRNLRRWRVSEYIVGNHKLWGIISISLKSSIRLHIVLYMKPDIPIHKNVRLEIETEGIFTLLFSVQDYRANMTVLWPLSLVYKIRERLVHYTYHFIQCTGLERVIDRIIAFFFCVQDWWEKMVGYFPFYSVYKIRDRIVQHVYHFIQCISNLQNNVYKIRERKQQYKDHFIQWTRLERENDSIMTILFLLQDKREQI